MMKKIVYVVSLIAILSSCASKKAQNNFEKIIFNSSACFGNCPIYNLQINQDKTFLLYKEENSRSPKLASGENKTTTKAYYKGIMSDKKYAELIAEIKRTDTLKLEGPNCCDAPIKTIIIYYNKKRKFVRTMFPTEEAKKLVALLYEVCKSEHSTQSEEAFEIEQASE